MTEPHQQSESEPSILPLRTHVRQAMANYFNDLGGHVPANLYRMVLQEVEPPLLEITLRFCQGNQSRAADILGINRSTLRKKLKLYGLDKLTAE